MDNKRERTRQVHILNGCYSLNLTYYDQKDSRIYTQLIIKNACDYVLFDVRTNTDIISQVSWSRQGMDYLLMALDYRNQTLVLINLSNDTYTSTTCNGLWFSGMEISPDGSLLLLDGSNHGWNRSFAFYRVTDRLEALKVDNKYEDIITNGSSFNPASQISMTTEEDDFLYPVKRELQWINYLDTDNIIGVKIINHGCYYPDLNMDQDEAEAKFYQDVTSKLPPGTNLRDIIITRRINDEVYELMHEHRREYRPIESLTLVLSDDQSLEELESWIDPTEARKRKYGQSYMKYERLYCEHVDEISSHYQTLKRVYPTAEICRPYINYGLGSRSYYEFRQGHGSDLEGIRVLLSIKDCEMTPEEKDILTDLFDGDDQSKHQEFIQSRLEKIKTLPTHILIFKDVAAISTGRYTEKLEGSVSETELLQCIESPKSS